MIAHDSDLPQILKTEAASAVLRVEQLASKVLSAGMLKGADNKVIEETITKLTDTESYTVIDFYEAQRIGLKIKRLKDDDPVWQKIWRLHCCYEYDAQLKGYAKITEGAVNSLIRFVPPPSS